jgi:hypothetical protein
LFGAGAVAAGPWFSAILVAAISACMGILNTDEVEELLPVGAFFLERGWAVADLDPDRGPVFLKAGVFHVVKVLVAGDRSSTEGLLFDRLGESPFFSALDPCFDQVAHASMIHEIFAREKARNAGFLQIDDYPAIRLGERSPRRIGLASRRTALRKVAVSTATIFESF